MMRKSLIHAGVVHDVGRIITLVVIDKVDPVRFEAIHLLGQEVEVFTNESRE